MCADLPYTAHGWLILEELSALWRERQWTIAIMPTIALKVLHSSTFPTTLIAWGHISLWFLRSVLQPWFLFEFIPTLSLILGKKTLEPASPQTSLSHWIWKIAARCASRWWKPHPSFTGLKKKAERFSQTLGFMSAEIRKNSILKLSYDKLSSRQLEICTLI